MFMVKTKKKLNMPIAGNNVEKLNSPSSLSRVKEATPTCKNQMGSFKKSIINLPYDEGCPLLSICSLYQK